MICLQFYFVTSIICIDVNKLLNSLSLFLHLSILSCLLSFMSFGSTSPAKGAHECTHKLPKGIWLPFDFGDSHPVSWFANFYFAQYMLF